MIQYVLSMSCISGDDLQVLIHRREDIFRWLKTLDHEGSTWSVVKQTLTDGEDGTDSHSWEIEHISEEIEREYTNG